MAPVRRLWRMRLRTPAIAAGFIALGAVLTVTEMGGTSATRGDSHPAVVQDSSAAPSEVGVRPLGGRQGAGDARAAGRADSKRGRVLVAKSWTHVRKARSRSADLEAVLTPGDTVYADSLERGWYRVALEGEVLGYAHESMLAPTEPGRP